MSAEVIGDAGWMGPFAPAAEVTMIQLRGMRHEDASELAWQLRLSMRLRVVHLDEPAPPSPIVDVLQGLVGHRHAQGLVTILETSLTPERFEELYGAYITDRTKDRDCLVIHGPAHRYIGSTLDNLRGPAGFRLEPRRQP